MLDINLNRVFIYKAAYLFFKLFQQKEKRIVLNGSWKVSVKCVRREENISRVRNIITILCRKFITGGEMKAKNVS